MRYEQGSPQKVLWASEIEGEIQNIHISTVVSCSNRVMVTSSLTSHEFYLYFLNRAHVGPKQVFRVLMGGKFGGTVVVN